MIKPKVFITPATVSFLGTRIEKHLDSLRLKFDVHSAGKKKDISKKEFLNEVKGSFAVIATPADVIDEEVTKAAGECLKVVTVIGSGYDAVDQAALKSRGIRLGTTGNVVVPGTAEMAVTLLLVASRHFMTFVNGYKRDPFGTFHPKLPTVGLEDSVIGIVGGGRIGESVAKKVVQFDISRLLYFSRSEKSELNILGGQLSSIENIARVCDYIILTLACNKETEHIMNKKIFDLMKPNAILVNIGRGGLINQNDLIEALQQRKIAGAALDVTTPEPLPPDHPLLQLDNVVVSPHIGGITEGNLEKRMVLAIQNITAVLENQKMPEEVIL